MRDEASCLIDNFIRLIAKTLQKQSQLSSNSFKVNALSNNEISQKQFYILIIVEYFNINTITDIAGHFCHTTGSTSITVTKLVKAGYLKGTHASGTETDKRRVYYEVTGKGKILLAEDYALFIEKLSSLIRELDEEKKGYFIEGYMQMKKVSFGLSSMFPAWNDKSPYNEPTAFDTETHLAADILKTSVSSVGWVNKIYANELSSEIFSDLTAGKYKIMWLIYLNGLTTIKEISSISHISESAISIMLSRLSSKNYLEKVYPGHDKDGRTISFFITDKGKLAVDEIQAKLTNLFISFLNKLEDDMKEAAINGIELLCKSFE